MNIEKQIEFDQIKNIWKEFAITILEVLKKSGTLFLVTTHYPEVKEYATKTEAIVNARMTFDKETLRPTYDKMTLCFN